MMVPQSPVLCTNAPISFLPMSPVFLKFLFTSELHFISINQLSCLMGGFSRDPLKGGPRKGLRERQLRRRHGKHYDNCLSLYYCVGNYCGSSGGISGLWSLMTFIVENTL